MRSLMATCIFVALPAIGAARTNEEILADAQSAFRAGVERRDKLLQARRDFARATDAYLELHENGVRSPALYRDLGNSSYLADRWPEAIWAYHMGLRLDPNHRGLRAQLVEARKKILYPAAGQGRPDPDSWPIWLYRPTSGEWFALFVLSYALACSAGAATWPRRSQPFALACAIAVLGCIAAAVGLWHAVDTAKHERDTPLAVIANNTPFYRGNGPSYPQHASAPILPRGMEARILHRRGDWLQLRLSTGEIGWLPRNQVLTVEP